MLPEEPPQEESEGATGRGCPRQGTALSGIIFVSKSTIPWEMLPQEMGCASGSTCSGDACASSIGRRPRGMAPLTPAAFLLERLGEAEEIDWERASLHSASVPTKRGARKPRIRPIGANRAREAPPCFRPKGRTAGGSALTGANIHNSNVFEEVLEAIEPIKHPATGRPRKRPEKLKAHKG